MTDPPEPPNGEPEPESLEGPEGKKAAPADATVDVAAGQGGTPVGGPSPREHRIALWVGVVAAVVGIPGAIAGLYLIFDPPGPTCSGTRSAAFGPPTLDAGRTYREFLRITRQPTGDTDKPTLDQIGTIITAPFTAEGYKGKELPLLWTTLTSGGAPVPEPGFDGVLAFAVTPEACSDGGPRKLWTPWPRRPGAYLVELALFDEDDESIATRRTPAFAVPAR